MRTRVNKIETMYGRSRVNVKVEPRSTFTFTRGLSYIASISFTRVKFTCVRTKKITRQWKSTLSQMTISSYRHKIRTLYLYLLLFIEALVYVF